MTAVAPPLRTPPARSCGSGRSLEVLLGFGILGFSSWACNALQFSQVVPDVQDCGNPKDFLMAGPAPECTVTDDPSLSMPISWVHMDGAPELPGDGACTPRQIRVCAEARTTETNSRYSDDHLQQLDRSWCCSQLRNKQALTPYMRVYKSLAIYGVFLPGAVCAGVSLGRSRGWLPAAQAHGAPSEHIDTG